jgi:hypothetical protein
VITKITSKWLWKMSSLCCNNELLQGKEANTTIKKMSGICCKWYQTNIFFPSNFCSKPIQPLITHNTIESDNLITNYMQHITIHELFFTWRKKKPYQLKTHWNAKNWSITCIKKGNKCTTLLIYITDAEVKLKLKTLVKS